MEYMHELKEKLCNELEEIANKGELGAGDLEIVHKLTDSFKIAGNVHRRLRFEGLIFLLTRCRFPALSHAYGYTVCRTGKSFW